MRQSVIILAAASAVFLSGCSEMPWYRQMQAEAQAKARITQLKAEGQAQLQYAESQRQSIVVNAQARKIAAISEAEREVIKARGVAQANTIMSQSLGGSEGYLRWKYIEMLEDNKSHQVIYLPTEAGLPILEAGKR